MPAQMWIETNCRKIPTILKMWTESNCRKIRYDCMSKSYDLDQIVGHFLLFEKSEVWLGLNQIVGKFLRFESSRLNQIV